MKRVLILLEPIAIPVIGSDRHDHPGVILAITSANDLPSEAAPQHRATDATSPRSFHAAPPASPCSR